MHICCKNPIIIRHKLLREYIIKSSHFCLNGKIKEFGLIDKYRLISDSSFLGSFFSTKLLYNLDDLDNFYVIDSITGECYPIFQVLPCGKCIVCKYKKTLQWMTRAFAENCTSSTFPLYITLTYNDLGLPVCGLLKEHCQLFMKRLRKRLSDDGYSETLRFYLAAEYGGNFGRPHYHLLLWNFPTMSYFEMVDYIQDAWSILISEERYLEIRSKTKSNVYVYTEPSKKWNLSKRCYDDITLYRLRLGFAYCLYVKEGAASYVMKYLRKDPNVPVGCVKPFQLYSRRHGLGSEWLDLNKQFYYDNPDQTRVEMYDPYTKSTHTANLPLYYSNRLFPSRSRLLPKDLRDSFSDWCILGNTLNALRRYFHYNIRPLDQSIIDKYSMLVPEPYVNYKDIKHDLICLHTDRVPVVKDSFLFPYTKRIDYEYIYSDDNYLLTRIFYDTKREFDFLTDFLLSFPLDRELYDKQMSMKSIHDGFLSELARQQSPIDVDSYADWIIRESNNAARKEIF